MRAVGLGIQSFEKVRSNHQFYVDKTAFIGEWFRKNDDITLITRPRRFGKTLTIDMLNCFFSKDYAGRKDLFEGLAVSRDSQIMELQGTVPTIKVSFSGIKGTDLRSFLRGIAGRISLLLDSYRDLLEGDLLSEEEKNLFREMNRAVPRIPDPDMQEEKYQEFLFQLTHILRFLSIWLFRQTGKKVFIFMDEYDTPVQSAYLNHYYDDAIGIMRELFSETFKENDQMSRALITGITRIARESLFSEMNNLAVYSVVSGGYDEVFGFTSGEMDGILEEYGIMEQKPLIRAWYDGFTFGKTTEIYNPWSVINYLARPGNPPADYWAQSGGLGLVDHLLRKSGSSFRDGFETLLSGGTIERRIREDLIYPRLDTDENAVWSLLIAAGYLKPVPAAGIQSSAASCKHTASFIQGPALPEKIRLTLTNFESRSCLSELVAGWFEGAAGNYMEMFADALLADDLWEMNAQMQQAVLLCVSGFDSGTKPSEGRIHPENFFHALTLGMLTCLSGTFLLTSNRESGFGRYDVCLEPLDQNSTFPPYILEFKVYNEKEGDSCLDDTAKRARQQIDGKKYDAGLLAKGYSPSQIRKYGFGFRGKEVVIVR